MVTKIVSKDKVFKESLEELDAILTQWAVDLDFAVTLHGLTVNELDEQVRVTVEAMPEGFPGSSLFQTAERIPTELRAFVQDMLAGAVVGTFPGRLVIR